MTYSQNNDSSWILAQLDHYIQGSDDSITSSTTTATTTTTIISTTTTNITTTSNNNNNNDDEAQQPPAQFATTIEEEAKIAQLMTPGWFQEMERLKESNLAVLTGSFEKIRVLEADLKEKNDLLKKFAEKTDELATMLEEKHQTN